MLKLSISDSNILCVMRTVNGSEIPHYAYT